MKWLLIAVGASIVLAGCASAPKPVDEQGGGSKSVHAGGFLEINYVRGNYRHRFFAIAKDDSVLAECYRDKQLLKSRNMEPAKFLELVKQARDLVDSPRGQASMDAPGGCRTPFTLRLKSDDSIKTIDGCRSSEQGVALGKLIKDAEFLVFKEN
jgi:hypothetical protein